MSNIYVFSCMTQGSLTWKIWDAYYDIFRVPRNGLQLLKKNKMSLIAYSDADWAWCPSTRRFSSSYCIFLGDYLISWSAKRQPIVSRSSAEAEYKGVANAVAEICLLWNLLIEMGCPLTQGSIVYCDNISAVYISSNRVQHQPRKHIEIDNSFRARKSSNGPGACSTCSIIASALIYIHKGIRLPSKLFFSFCSSLGFLPPDDQTAGRW